jgi:hypothetical protein
MAKNEVGFGRKSQWDNIHWDNVGFKSIEFGEVKGEIRILCKVKEEEK